MKNGYQADGQKTLGAGKTRRRGPGPPFAGDRPGLAHAGRPKRTEVGHEEEPRIPRHRRRTSATLPTRATAANSDAAKSDLSPANPASPRAVVKKYDAKITLTPKLSVGTAMPESIYVADFQRRHRGPGPQGRAWANVRSICRCHRRSSPWPRSISASTACPARLPAGGQPPGLAWAAGRQQDRDDRRQLFRHRQGGLHARKAVREDHRSVPHGPGRQPQQHPHVGTLAPAEQAGAVQRQHHLHLGLQPPGRGPSHRHRHARHRGAWTASAS